MLVRIGVKSAGLEGNTSNASSDKSFRQRKLLSCNKSIYSLTASQEK
jgi:hypothetical protein